ncbi:hypothetical protein BKA70DRAFT_1394101 [Coprinopsis sp. MPI-PUGE-AT-0042]|nr:hypothetical protein BKA70DRAFT_1394101 [Coprinopsis sp. MPI-PUGE-AT-0042]
MGNAACADHNPPLPGDPDAVARPVEISIMLPLAQGSVYSIITRPKIAYLKRRDEALGGYVTLCFGGDSSGCSSLWCTQNDDPTHQQDVAWKNERQTAPRNLATEMMIVRKSGVPPEASMGSHLSPNVRDEDPEGRAQGCSSYQNVRESPGLSKEEKNHGLMETDCSEDQHNSGPGTGLKYEARGVIVRNAEESGRSREAPHWSVIVDEVELGKRSQSA